MPLFFAKSIKGVMNERIDDHNNRCHNKEPQEGDARRSLLKKVGAKKQHWHNEPEPSEYEFQRDNRVAARNRRQ